MVIDKTIFQTNAPSHSDVIWAKPEEDKITLHMYNRGKWVPVSGAINQDVKKTYTVDPNAILLTRSTKTGDIVTEDLQNTVKSELNIDHDAPYSDEELLAMDKALLSKINDNKYRTRDHGMATATALNIDGGNLVFTCDDGTLLIINPYSDASEFQTKEPFSVTIDGVQSAAIIAQAKVLGIDIDKYLPNITHILEGINIAWSSYNSDYEYIAAINKVNDELKSMQYITEEHGSAELKVIAGYITDGAKLLFKCEDGTIINVSDSGFVKEYLPAPDYTRFLLVNDLYGDNDWEYDQSASYIIVDTKDTEGKITDEVLDNRVAGIPDLENLHNYTDTIYMPVEAILFKIDTRISSCSNFFKLHKVNPDYIGIPSDIQAIVDAADQEVDPNAYLITEQTTIFDSFMDAPESTLASQSYRTLQHGAATFGNYSSSENVSDVRIYFNCLDDYVAVVGPDGTEFMPRGAIKKSAPTLKVNGGSSSGIPVSIWKTTVQLSDNTLAYIFMEISTTPSSPINPFGTQEISMSSLYFSDSIDSIPNYGASDGK